MFLLLLPYAVRRGGRESVLLLPERFGVRKPDGIKFSAPFKTIPGVHPASCTMGTASFPGIKRPERGDDHSPRASTESKERMEQAIPVLHFCAFMVMSRRKIILRPTVLEKITQK